MSQRTLTVGSPWRVILLFTVPLLIGNLVQQMYHVIDAMVVGNVLGVTSLAAVGATGSLLFLLLGFAWGMTSGFAIPTAQAFGAGDLRGVRRSVAAGALLSAGVSIFLTIVAPLIARPVLVLLRTPPELLDQATTFAVISFLGAGATMFFNFLSAIIRAIGDSRTPLIFLVIACLMNVVLVVAFVAWLGYGVGGAALATVLSQLLSVVLCLLFVRRRLPVLHVQREDWRVTRAELGHHLHLGLPMGFQASIIAIGTLAVQVALNTLGADAVAAYTTATRVDGLAIAFLASLGLAVSTFSAQNYGAGLMDRIRVGVRQSLWMSVAGGLALAAVLITAGGPIVRSFVGNDAEGVVDMAHWFLVTNGSLYVVLGVLFVLRGALQGLGYTLVPTLTGVIELVMRVGAAIILGALFGFTGIVWGNPLAWVGAVVLLVPAWRAARLKLATTATPSGASAAFSGPNAFGGSDTVKDTTGVGDNDVHADAAPMPLGVSEADRDMAVSLLANSVPDEYEPHDDAHGLRHSTQASPQPSPQPRS
ncbi:MATE family efflux transporter [Jonesia quinghaiensis]|uniref:MATE family efflux transporter n=1 Tax=Jonesia quinghaiensis TaxID=262806 RepID=UPI000A04FE38|nr:MATE family efflux transporter [Jonesia quinghaiensis]